jgi:Domain of unknown function (DUF4268)
VAIMFEDPTPSGLAELDSKNLGRLKRVADPRDVWKSEAGDFTPWLAENIDVLADTLGMVLTVTGTEVPVGDFRLDIRAEDGEGRPVVIENQLGSTDHSHLGQCLVYASGLEASTVVWVAPRVRDDFRRAFDWLNERTDVGVRFFAVEVSLVQIASTGPMAPVFDVVSRPNDWAKGVKVADAVSDVTTTLNAARQDFFSDVLTGLHSRQPGVRVPARGTGNWLAFASGPFGTWSIGATSGIQMRVEVYIDCGDRVRNKQLFDELQMDSRRWENAAGGPLSWERMDDKRASRIACYHELDLEDDASRSQAKAWAVTTLATLFGSMNAELRSRALAIRQAFQAGENPPAGRVQDPVAGAMPAVEGDPAPGKGRSMV